MPPKIPKIKVKKVKPVKSKRPIYNIESVKNKNKVSVNIKHKIMTRNLQDKNQYHRKGGILIKDIKRLLKLQNNKCAVCQDALLTNNWEPFCCYQFSIEKINSKLLYDGDNIYISCYYCSSRSHPEFTQHNKVCDSGCHTEPRDLPTKEMVLSLLNTE